MEAFEDLLLLLSEFLVRRRSGTADLRTEATIRELRRCALKVSESLFTGFLYVLIINKSHMPGNFFAKDIRRQLFLVVLQ